MKKSKKIGIISACAVSAVCILGVSAVCTNLIDISKMQEKLFKQR